MRDRNPIEELADLRVEISRLLARERALVARIETGQDTMPMSGPRSGWPIQRRMMHAAAQ